MDCTWYVDLIARADDLHVGSEECGTYTLTDTGEEHRIRHVHTRYVEEDDPRTIAARLAYEEARR